MYTTMPDPTQSFSLLVISIMMIRFLLAHEWEFSLLLSGFFLNPYVILSFVLAALVKWWFCSSALFQKLSVRDQWTAEWYWWNAWFYHMVLDGFAGSLHLVPVVLHQYQIMDKRFVTEHSVPWTVGMVELCFMGPMCLLVYWLIVQRHPLRFPMEILVASFQIMGMIVFVYAEIYEGQLNVPALDPVGQPGNRWANVKFNQYHLTYYWFGFWFCNHVWLIIPGYRVARGLQACHWRLKEHED